MDPPRRRRSLLVLPAVAYAALIVFVSTRPGGDIPSTGIAGGDKGLHVLEYFVLGALLLLPVRGLGWRGRLAALAVGFAFAAFDEFLQTAIPGRFGDAADFAMDVVGLLAAVELDLAAKLARRPSVS